MPKNKYFGHSILIKLPIILITILIFIITTQSGSHAQKKDSMNEAKDLQFIGTVIDIRNEPIESVPPMNWVIVFKVEKVTQGNFSGDKFSIRVHSPSLSNLEKGKKYTVKAEWTGNGYYVDAYQIKGMQ